MIRCPAGVSFLCCLCVVQHQPAKYITERFCTVKVESKLNDVGRVTDPVLADERVLLFFFLLIFSQIFPFKIRESLQPIYL